MPVSCQCGACKNCKNRIYAALRRLDPEIAARHRDEARRWYRDLSPEEKRTRSASRAEYQRQYKQANREAIKQQNAKNHAAKREERSANARERYQKDRERRIAKAKERHAANPQAAVERAAKWAKENPERRSLQVKVTTHKRRARINGSGGTVTTKQLRDLFDRQGCKCAGCKKRLGKFEDTGKWHHDHVMPIALGGANTIENAQILCQSCNRRKHAKHPQVWAAELGRLFA